MRGAIGFFRKQLSSETIKVPGITPRMKAAPLSGVSFRAICGGSDNGASGWGAGWGGEGRASGVGICGRAVAADTEQM